MSSEPARRAVSNEAHKIAFVDAHYFAGRARAACVLANAWRDTTPHAEWTVELEQVADYRPGHFFERELPCILAALARAPEAIEVIVVDGYVVLDEHGKPGLGEHVFRHFSGRIPVVGIAKRSYAGSHFAAHVLRGASQSPLFVTARGIPLTAAAEHVRLMHGPFRIPTLCTRVDQLCRGLI